MLRLGLLVPLLVPLLVLCRRFGRQGRTDHCYDLVVVAVAAAAADWNNWNTMLLYSCIVLESVSIGIVLELSFRNNTRS